MLQVQVFRNALKQKNLRSSEQLHRFCPKACNTLIGESYMTIRACSDEPDKEKNQKFISFKEFLKIKNYFSRTVHNPEAFYQGED